MKKIKYTIYFVWVIALLLGPVAILTNPFFLGFKTSLSTINYIQRATALAALTAIAFQIYTGAFLPKHTEKWGGWIYPFHITQGITIISLAIIHAMSLFVFNYVAKGAIDPFYIFTDFCLVCKVSTDLFITLGRISFWLLVLTVIAAKVRTLPWWRRNWRYIHILNYVVFYIISAHAFFIGSDTRITFFKYFFIILQLFVLYTIVIRFKGLLRKSK